MSKGVLLAIIAILSLQSIVFAEDVTKNLEVYIEGSSGNFNKNAGPILNADMEAGLKYRQNFANAKWLRLTTQFTLEGSSAGIQNSNGDFIGNNVKNSQGISGYIKLITSFTEHFFIAINSAGRIDSGVGYSITLPENQHLSFLSEVNFYPTGNSLYAVKGNHLGEKAHSIVDYFGIHMTYAVAIAKQWDYSSEVRFRFSGIPLPGIESDSARAFGESLNIRWDNSVTYNDPNGISAWFQIRYKILNIANGTALRHSPELRGGVTYKYDLSSL